MSDLKQPLVTETEGRSYVTRAVLLLVNGPAATAEAVHGPTELVVPGLLPIYRIGTTQVIGYGAVEQVGPMGLTVKLFLDYSTPERLELETGSKKYLELIQRHPEEGMWVLTQHLELTDKAPDDERVLPVGAPELALY